MISFLLQRFHLDRYFNRKNRNLKKIADLKVCGNLKAGSPTSFWKGPVPKNTLNLKNRASLANKATVSVSPKLLQLDL